MPTVPDPSQGAAARDRRSSGVSPETIKPLDRPAHPQVEGAEAVPARRAPASGPARTVRWPGHERAGPEASAPGTSGPTVDHPRLVREFRTLAAMLHTYCRAHHGGSALCGECQALRDYAETRLARCRFQEDKPTCVKCPVHCYRPDARERVRQVMRFAGPRMLWRHPVMSLRHWLDGFRPAPRSVPKP